MIVLDANILIRAVLGRRARHILESYGEAGIRFFIPDAMLAETEKHLPKLLDKVSRPASEAIASLDYLKEIVEVVTRDSYVSHEFEARQLLRGRDEDDWQVLAAALALNCPIWTEDTDFFGTGAAVWTTKNIEIYLKAQLRSAEPRDEE